MSTHISSQQLIEFIKQRGHTDQEIADAVHCARETITRIRLGYRDSGQIINRKLRRIAASLIQQQNQQHHAIQQPVQQSSQQSTLPVTLPVQSTSQSAPQYLTRFCVSCQGLIKGKGHCIRQGGTYSGDIGSWQCDECFTRNKVSKVSNYSDSYRQNESTASTALSTLSRFLSYTSSYDDDDD